MATHPLARATVARFESIGRLQAIGLWAAAVAILTVPFIEDLRPIDWLDDSWAAGLQIAARQGVQYGSDIVFTYGPLGTLTLDRAFMMPETLASLGGALVVHLALVLLLAHRMAISATSPQVWAVATGILLLRTSFEYETQFVILLLFALSLEYGRAAPLIPAAGLSALLCLFKSSDTVGVLAMMVVVIGVLAYRRHWRPVVLVLAAFAIFLSGLWLLAGQTLTGVPLYVRGAYEVVAGFGPAMSLNNFGLGPLVGALTAVGLLGMTVLMWRRNDPSRIVLLLALPVLVVAFRVNFTRNDSQHTLLSLYVAILVILLAVISVRRPTWMARTLLIALVPFSLLGVTASQYSQLSATDQRFTTYRTLASLDSESSSLRQAARDHYALSANQIAVLSSGTVDVLPWDLLLPYGYGFAWRPRPALQSYSAYTPYLDRLDAEHFSRTGPDHVLYLYEDIDNRYPLFDEPSAVQALIANYIVDPASDSRYLLLDRRASSTRTRRVDLGRSCAAMGTAITVPRPLEGMLFASIHVPYSAAGEILKTAYAPPSLFITLTAGGEDHSHRLVGATAADGVLLDGYAANAAEVAGLFGGQASKPIRSLTVSTHHRFAYARQFCADFFALTSS